MIKEWFLLFRPKTLVVSFAPIVIAIGMAYKESKMNIFIIIAIFVSALLIQIGTNLVNDYYDNLKGTDTASRKGPKRAVQSGSIKTDHVRIAFIASFVLALVPGAYLVYKGGIVILLIGLFSILFAWLYTGGPYPLAYNGLGDVFVFIFFGPVAVAGSYYLLTSQVSTVVLLSSFAPGLLASAVLCVNNYRDYSEDKQAGKNTIVVKFGRAFGKMEYVFLILLSFFLPVILYLFFNASVYIFITCILLIPALKLIKDLFSLTGEKLNPVLGKTAVLLFLYSLLFAFSWNIV